MAARIGVATICDSFSVTQGIFVLGCFQPKLRRMTMCELVEKDAVCTLCCGAGSSAEIQDGPLCDASGYIISADLKDLHVTALSRAERQCVGLATVALREFAATGARLHQMRSKSLSTSATKHPSNFGLRVSRFQSRALPNTRATRPN